LVRLSHSRILVTPSGLPKAELCPDDLVEVDLGGTHWRGYREASSELDLHLRAYRQRSDCGAVVHAHPPAATAFAVAGEGLPGDVLPEIALLMGQVPCIPCQTTGTPALRDAAEP
jgi:L-fuculose-phosphate aldolase